MERRVAGDRREPLSRQDVAEASFRPVGLDPEKRDLLGMLVDKLRHLSDVRPEPALVADVVIARKHGNRRVRLPAGQGKKAEEHAGAGVAVPRLHEQILGGQRGELGPRELEVAAVDDHDRPLPRHERGDARERRLEEGAVAEDAAVLLGDRRAADQPRQLPEAGPVAAGEHESPETVCRPVRHAGSMRGRPAGFRTRHAAEPYRPSGRMSIERTE